MFVKILNNSIIHKSTNCFIPKDIFISLGLSETLCYTLHAGKLTSNIYVLPHEANGSAIYLSNIIINELCIYENMLLNIWKENNDIYLGPVVGVLVSKDDLALIKSGVISAAMKSLFKANEQSHCLLYYFSNENFYINNKTAYGYTQIESSEKLIKLALPIADTIYEQINSASQEEFMAFQYMRKMLTHYHNIQYINNHMYLGKWEIYKCLLSQKELNPYLPKTISYDEFEDIKLFLDYFGSVTLMPSYKSSKDIIYIEKSSLKYKLYSKTDTRLLLAKDSEELEKIVTDYTKGELFLVQQNILGIKQPAECLNILLGKSSKGKWMVIASPKCLQKGSLELLFLRLGTCIEKNFGPFGEIELLVALDSYEKPWIVDINIPPASLENFSQMYEAASNLRCLSILEYSKYLTLKNYDA